MKDKEKQKMPPGGEETGLQEQMTRRQSAPRQEAQELAQGLLNGRGGIGTAQAQNGAVDGFRALGQVIGSEQVRKARQILQKYKQGKHNLEQKIIENEQWYKLRHWDYLRRKNAKEEVEPISAWLFNSIANKHADAMDNFPSPNILPREQGDRDEAQRLSSIVPVILEQNGFEATYDTEANDKFVGGTGIYGVFWDESKLHGLGDIEVSDADILSLFWEPGITKIQKSRNLFHVTLQDNDLLIEQWPQLEGKLGSSTLELAKYVYDDTVDTSGKSAVVDWYYKKRRGGRDILHYCKFVNDDVLTATENDPERYPNGLYDHGMYPYVFDPLFRLKGTPCGFGYVDIAKSAQEYIDRGGKAVMKNLLANAGPRHFVRSDGEVNEQEYADMTKDFVHVGGNLGQDSIMPIQGKPLSDIYVAVLNNKVDELKEVTGNRDVSTGGTTGGVTAASGLAAMMEAGSKLSRDSNKASYRAYREVVQMVIELIRQFYDMPRCFRITGENGAQDFVEYSNAGIRPQDQGVEMGVRLGYRVPLFDIEITAQKSSPYSKMAQNELALQLYAAGFFNPQMADQALACLDMMDFDRKHFIMQRIAQNGGMYQQMIQMQQQMLQMAQIIDQTRGTNMAEQMAAGITGGPAPAPAPGQGGKGASETEALGGEAKESHHTRKAREQVAQSTSPT